MNSTYNAAKGVSMNYVVRKKDASSSIRFWAAFSPDNNGRILHSWAPEDQATTFFSASDANMVARAAQHHGYGPCEVVPHASARRTP